MFWRCSSFSLAVPLTLLKAVKGPRSDMDNTWRMHVQGTEGLPVA